MAYRIPMEHDTRLDDSATGLAPCDLSSLHGFFHLLTVKLGAALDTTLPGHASMCLHKALDGDTSLTLERVDVLRETRLERASVREEPYECMGQRGPVAARV